MDLKDALRKGQNLEEPLFGHGFGGSSLVIVWIQMYTSAEFFLMPEVFKRNLLAVLSSRLNVVRVYELVNEMEC
jgi:hypothetical protein